nr:hypothetical protein [Tanacetum cinerariifolium]
MSLRTTILGQMTEIKELHAADRRRQTVILEMLRADYRRSTEIIELRTALQGQVTTLQGQKQMAPKQTTRSTADHETINATSIPNAQLQTVGHEAAYGMPWKTLMKMITEKYCPRNEIRKLEMEL